MPTDSRLATSVRVAALAALLSTVLGVGLLARAAVASPSPEVLAAMVALADDPDPRVRHHAALAAGDLPREVRAPMLARIARRDAGDRWTRAAIVSSAGDVPLELLRALADAESEGANSSDPATEAGMLELYGSIGTTLGARLAPAELAGAIDSLAGPAFGDLRAAPARARVLRGMLDGMKLAGEEPVPLPAAREALDRMRGAPGPGGAADAETARYATALAERLAPADLATRREAAEAALARGLDPSVSETERVAALDSLTAASIGLAGESACDRLGEALSLKESDAVQSAAIAALGRARDPVAGPAAGVAILRRWRGVSPALRPRALDALFARHDRLTALVGALESGELSPAALDADRRARLLAHPDAALAARASAVLGETDEERERETEVLLERFRPALSMAGDPTRGATIHRERCAACHRAGGVGSEVGPSWASIRAADPEKLLLGILAPSRSISPGFAAYVVETTDGGLESGLLAASTPGGIVLRRGGGEELSILRSRVRSLNETRLSLMPEGLAEGLEPGDMADLLAFLREAE